MLFVMQFQEIIWQMTWLQTRGTARETITAAILKNCERPNDQIILIFQADALPLIHRATYCMKANGDGWVCLSLNSIGRSQPDN